MQPKIYSGNLTRDKIYTGDLTNNMRYLLLDIAYERGLGEDGKWISPLQEKELFLLFPFLERLKTVFSVPAYKDSYGDRYAHTIRVMHAEQLLSQDIFVQPKGNVLTEEVNKIIMSVICSKKDRLNETVFNDIIKKIKLSLLSKKVKNIQIENILLAKQKLLTICDQFPKPRDDAGRMTKESVIDLYFDYYRFWGKALSVRLWNSQFLLRFFLAVHDLGTIKGVPKHFLVSAIYVLPYLTKIMHDARYPPDIEKNILGEVIIANHSYFGDFLLGEGSLEWGKHLYNRIFKGMGWVDADFTWSMLWFLTIFDMCGVGKGVLNEEKYQQMLNLRTYNNFLQNYGEDQLKHRLNLMNPYFSVTNLLKPGLERVYLQYAYFLITPKLCKRIENPYNNKFLEMHPTEKRLVGEVFLDALTNLWNKTRVKEIGLEDNLGSDFTYNYDFITFLSGISETDDEIAYQIHCRLAERIKNCPSVEASLDLVNKTFYGYTYKIGGKIPVDGVLEKYLVEESKDYASQMIYGFQLEPDSQLPDEEVLTAERLASIHIKDRYLLINNVDPDLKAGLVKIIPGQINE